MNDLIALIASKYNYWAFIVLMMIGLYAMIVKKNLVKKIIGMNIFQTSIILFYISVGAKERATIPIIEHGHGPTEAIKAVNYINPLPHVLMLTAIVVSVATLGVALALAIRVYRQYQTLEEDEIQSQINSHESYVSGTDYHGPADCCVTDNGLQLDTPKMVFSAGADCFFDFPGIIHSGHGRGIGEGRSHLPPWRVEAANGHRASY